MLGVMAIGALANSNNSTIVSPQTEISPPAQQPSTETKQETKEEVIIFSAKTIDDSSLAAGETKVSQEGKNGKIIHYFEVTYTDGKETGRKLLKDERVESVEKITVRGTKVASKPAPAPKPTLSCDPNYSGCVPIDSDVDCAGGSGNGPSYVRGPIRVLGFDIYGLDRDGNGIACE